MRHRIPRGFTLVALLILSLAVGCKGEPDVDTSSPGPAAENAPAPPAPPAGQAGENAAPLPPPAGGRGMGPIMTPELRAALATFREGDVKGARDQFQAALDNARKGGAGVAERGALMGLARTNACLGEKEAAAETFEELWRVRTGAVGEADPGLFWDALEAGFTHTALGNTTEARRWFQRAVQVLDNAPEELPWFERAKLVPQWMMLRAGDTSLEAEVQERMRMQKDEFRGPLVGFLKNKRKDMEICEWDRQVADVDAFAREVGFDQDPMWTSSGLPGEGGPPPAPAR